MAAKIQVCHEAKSARSHRDPVKSQPHDKVAEMQFRVLRDGMPPYFTNSFARKCTTPRGSDGQLTAVVGLGLSEMLTLGQKPKQQMGWAPLGLRCRRTFELWPTYKQPCERRRQLEPISSANDPHFGRIS